ncbi:MAG TPA: hypothetical protein VL443_03715 [Cyclobacteriaceae bacterium]|nr:hypothetical protein [Cyclobacteriaceae bacterium]
MRYLYCIAFSMLVILLFTRTNAQTMNGDLTLVKGRIFKIESDSLVIKNLIMHDSSTLVLMAGSQSYYLKLNKLVFGANCQILCSSTKGTNGRDGREPETPSGPCKSGLPGEAGQNGANGKPGNTLTMEVSSVESTGKKTFGIYLNGGDGGDGGDGGNGSNGYRGTKFCVSNGGDGGNGGNGGDGGKGGILIVHSSIDSTAFKSKVTVFVNGGYKGYGGRSGNGGALGPGSSEKSKNGARGKEGLKGKNGPSGKIFFKNRIS